VPHAELDKEPTEDAAHSNHVSSAQATTSKVSGAQGGFRFLLITFVYIFFIILLYVYVIQSQLGQEAVQESSRPQPLSTSEVVAVSLCSSGVVKIRTAVCFSCLVYVYVPQAEPDKEPTEVDPQSFGRPTFFVG
jgi:ABC-type sulfate transport system permease component